MKKPNSLFLAIVATAIMGTTFISCQKKSEYPVAPTNGQVYVDPSGNRNTWNSALQCWMIYSIMNNRPGGTYYYYPSTGTYQNSNHQAISRPGHLPAVRSASSTRSSMSRSSSSSSSRSSGGFGSSSRGSSAS